MTAAPWFLLTLFKFEMRVGDAEERTAAALLRRHSRSLRTLLLIFVLLVLAIGNIRHSNSTSHIDNNEIAVWSKIIVEPIALSLLEASKAAASQSAITEGGHQLEIVPQAFAYLLACSGLGSQLMNFFAKAIYFEEAQNRSMIAIESTYRYRRNASVGVLTGFFTPQFPVIDTGKQYPSIQQHIPDLNITQWISATCGQINNNKPWMAT
jgi:hypothetical protein